MLISLTHEQKWVISRIPRRIIPGAPLWILLQILRQTATAILPIDFYKKLCLRILKTLSKKIIKNVFKNIPNEFPRNTSKDFPIIISEDSGICTNNALEIPLKISYRFFSKNF